jgi:hypothetical protein
MPAGRYLAGRGHTHPWPHGIGGPCAPSAHSGWLKRNRNRNRTGARRRPLVADLVHETPVEVPVEPVRVQPGVPHIPDSNVVPVYIDERSRRPAPSQLHESPVALDSGGDGEHDLHRRWRRRRNGDQQHRHCPSGIRGCDVPNRVATQRSGSYRDRRRPAPTSPPPPKLTRFRLRRTETALRFPLPTTRSSSPSALNLPTATLSGVSNVSSIDRPSNIPRCRCSGQPLGRGTDSR